MDNPPLNFSMSQNFAVGKFSSQKTKFGAGNTPFCPFGKGGIEILSTRNLLCRKIATSCPAQLFNCSFDKTMAAVG